MGTTRILIVDDEKAIVKMLEMMLQKRGISASIQGLYCEGCIAHCRK